MARPYRRVESRPKPVPYLNLLKFWLEIFLHGKFFTIRAKALFNNFPFLRVTVFLKMAEPKARGKGDPVEG